MFWLIEICLCDNCSTLELTVLSLVNFQLFLVNFNFLVHFYKCSNIYDTPRIVSTNPYRVQILCFTCTKLNMFQSKKNEVLRLRQRTPFWPIQSSLFIVYNPLRRAGLTLTEVYLRKSFSSPMYRALTWTRLCNSWKVSQALSESVSYIRLSLLPCVFSHYE